MQMSLTLCTQSSRWDRRLLPFRLTADIWATDYKRENLIFSTAELLKHDEFFNKYSDKVGIYKYIFVSKGDNITYHEVSGRLNSIKLELYTNSEYPTT